jgi:hypothetical protein
MAVELGSQYLVIRLDHFYLGVALVNQGFMNPGGTLPA